MSDENGPDDASGPPEGEEEQVEETRRVKPLFRFGRRKNKEEPVDMGNGDEEEGTVDEEDSRGPVRPVRVVRFIPSVEEDQRESQEVGPISAEEDDSQLIGEEEAQFQLEEEAQFQLEEETPFQVEEETPFQLEEETPFQLEEEVPFQVEEETPFQLEEEASFQIEEETPFQVEEEVPFQVEEETPFQVEEETPFQVEEEASFVEDGETPFIEDEGTGPFAEEEATPAPVGEMEATRWEEPIRDTLSIQEEAETGGEFEFRSEESPEAFEAAEEEAPTTPSPSSSETKPHYHKYLKPDEELLSRHPAKGPATGFDRDMDADAGEIDFGIDLIDPSERRKKRKKPPRKDKEPGPKKGVGGHDFDAEVDARGTGAEVGVDYEKRRKRRL